jgi:hypothetical protein
MPLAVLGATVKLIVCHEALATWHIGAAFGAPHHILRGSLTRAPTPDAAPRAGSHDPVHEKHARNQHKVLAHKALPIKDYQASLPHSAPAVELESPVRAMRAAGV